MGKISELDAANEINREDRSCTNAGYIMELAIKHTRGGDRAADRSSES